MDVVEFRAGPDDHTKTSDAAFPPAISHKLSPSGRCRVATKLQMQSYFETQNTKRLSEKTQSLADRLGDAILVSLNFENIGLFLPGKTPRRIKSNHEPPKPIPIDGPSQSLIDWVEAVLKSSG